MANGVTRLVLSEVVEKGDGKKVLYDAFDNADKEAAKYGYAKKGGKKFPIKNTKGK